MSEQATTEAPRKRPRPLAGLVQMPAEAPEPEVLVSEKLTDDDWQRLVRRLEQENAELKAKAALQAQVDVPLPAGEMLGAKPGLYRVSLPGCWVRSVDAEGRVGRSAHLDVEAISPADAFEKFRAFNGIIRTSQVPQISLVPAGEAAPAGKE